MELGQRVRRVTVGALLVLLAVGALIAFASPPNPVIWDARVYADTAQHIAVGDGIRTGVPNGPGTLPRLQRPQYPPGLPVLLAPFAAAHHVRAGARLLSFLALLAVAWAAWSVAGPLAALLATAALLSAPFYGESARTVMADMPSAGLAAVALALLVRGSPRWLILAGVACGVGVTVRYSHLPIMLAALLAVGAGRRWVAVGAAPPLLALMAYQWHAFGSPLRTGYGHGSAQWAAGNITTHALPTDLTVQLGHLTPFSPPPGIPNLVYWPLALGLWWVFALPGFGYLGLVAVWRRRSTVAGRFVTWSILGMLLLLLPYFWRGTRIIAPAAVLLVVMASCAVVDAVDWLAVRRVAPSARRLDSQRVQEPASGISQAPA